MQLKGITILRKDIKGSSDLSKMFNEYVDPDKANAILCAGLVGASAELAHATDRMNQYQIKQLLEIIRPYLFEGGRIGIFRRRRQLARSESRGAHRTALRAARSASRPRTWSGSLRATRRADNAGSAQTNPIEQGCDRITRPPQCNGCGE